MTVTVGSLVLGTDLVFRSVTPYVPVPAGTYTVTVRSSTAAATAPPLVTGHAHVVSGGAVTAAAVAAPNSASSGGAIDVQMFADDLAAPATGEAKVRVIHALPGVAKVTTQLSMTSPAGSASLTSNPAVDLAPVGYGQASPYLSVAAGTYELKVGPAGKASIVTGQNWPVKAGTVASVVLVQTSSGPTIEVLSDAVTASSTPTGAVQTGYGGTAPKPVGPLIPVSMGAAALLLGVAAVRRRALRISGVDEKEG